MNDMDDMEDLMESDPLVARAPSYASTFSTREHSVSPLRLSERRANFADNAISSTRRDGVQGLMGSNRPLLIL